MRFTLLLPRWDYEPYSFGITYNAKRKLSPLNNTLPLLKMADSQYHNGTVSVVLTTRGYKTTASPKFGVYVDSQLCPPKGCPVPPVPSIGTPMLWSKKASWQNKALPVAGQKVTIDSNMWIVMDITPPNLGSLVVNGKLSFLSNTTRPLTLTLTVKDISVYGIFEISGGPDVNNNNATLPFAGDATVVVYGTKGSSLPIVMGEGVYLGAKVIGVSGQLIAYGQHTTRTWTRLRTTVNAGSKEVALSKYVNWKAGDEVVLSPTGYFNEVGTAWSSKTSISGGSSDEKSVIASIRNATDATTHTTYSILTLTRAANHTHVCTTRYGQSFCGAVGLLSRSVRFQSRDSETPGVSSYGFGADLHVFDIVPKTGATAVRRGSVYLNNVLFKNFGKINSDRYAIQFEYTDYNHPASTITNCAFNAGYSMATRAAHTANFTFTNNVALGNWGGGVFITQDNKQFVVNSNLLVGTRQLPSTLLSSYPWLRPIAGITVQSSAGVVKNNLAAGSEGEGYGKYCCRLIVCCFVLCALFYLFIIAMCNCATQVYTHRHLLFALHLTRPFPSFIFHSHRHVDAAPALAVQVLLLRHARQAAGLQLRRHPQQRPLRQQRGRGLPRRSDGRRDESRGESGRLLRRGDGLQGMALWTHGHPGDRRSRADPD